MWSHGDNWSLHAEWIHNNSLTQWMCLSVYVLTELHIMFSAFLFKTFPLCKPNLLRWSTHVLRKFNSLTNLHQHPLTTQFLHACLQPLCHLVWFHHSRWMLYQNFCSSTIFVHCISCTLSCSDVQKLLCTSRVNVTFFIPPAHFQFP